MKIFSIFSYIVLYLNSFILNDILFIPYYMSFCLIFIELFFSLIILNKNDEFEMNFMFLNN